MRVSPPPQASFLFIMPLFRAKAVCPWVCLVLGMDAYVKKTMLVREDNQNVVNAQLFLRNSGAGELFHSTISLYTSNISIKYMTFPILFHSRHGCSGGVVETARSAPGERGPVREELGRMALCFGWKA